MDKTEQQEMRMLIQERYLRSRLSSYRLKTNKKSTASSHSSRDPQFSHLIGMKIFKLADQNLWHKKNDKKHIHKLKVRANTKGYSLYIKTQGDDPQFISIFKSKRKPQIQFPTKKTVRPSNQRRKNQSYYEQSVKKSKKTESSKTSSKQKQLQFCRRKTKNVLKQIIPKASPARSQGVVASLSLNRNIKRMGSSQMPKYARN